MIEVYTLVYILCGTADCSPTHEYVVYRDLPSCQRAAGDLGRFAGRYCRAGAVEDPHGRWVEAPRRGDAKDRE